MAPDENGGLLGAPLAELGIPGEDEYLERYYALAGSTERMTPSTGLRDVSRGGRRRPAWRAWGGGNAFLPDAARVGTAPRVGVRARGMPL